MLGIGRTESAAWPAGASAATSANRIWVPGAGVVGGGRGSIGPRGDPREPRLRLGIGQSREHAGGNRRQRVRKGLIRLTGR